MEQKKTITIPLKSQKLSAELAEMLLEEHIDDLMEMVEDHCLMVAFDQRKTSTKLAGIRSWSELSDTEWDRFVEELKQLKILGTPISIIERYDYDGDVDELLISWGYKS